MDALKFAKNLLQFLIHKKHCFGLRFEGNILTLLEQLDVPIVRGTEGSVRDAALPLHESSNHLPTAARIYSTLAADEEVCFFDCKLRLLSFTVKAGSGS